MDLLNRKKGSILLLLVLITVFPPVKALRVGSSVRTRPIIISIVPKSLDNPMLVEAKAAAELTARRLNVQVEWVGPFKVDVDTQIQIIEGLIRRKVDGIAVSCSDEERLRPVIDKAVAAGIKVATIGADAPEATVCFIAGPIIMRPGWSVESNDPDRDRKGWTDGTEPGDSNR